MGVLQRGQLTLCLCQEGLELTDSRLKDRVLCHSLEGEGGGGERVCVSVCVCVCVRKRERGGGEKHEFI